MLSYNCMQKATNVARGGDLRQAQAIMKGFKRGMKKNTTNEEQHAVYQEIDNQIGSVYSKMGDQVRDLSDSEEQVIMRPSKKAAMNF